MTKAVNPKIRNLAIIAHVDHGKTTLVDALLKQGNVFRSNQDVGELIMDTNPLERERGITILSKNTAVYYQDVKINIIDTPGHADFSGEVERIMNMADGCLLLVDAVDGPMPQTRYVLRQALQQNVKPMVVINKIDRPEARVAEVEELVQDLFLEIAITADQLDYPVLYASARNGYALAKLGDTPKDLSPLLDAILETIPPPESDEQGPLQMLVAALDYDNYIGQVAIGRVFRGKLSGGDSVAHIGRDGVPTTHRLEKLFVFHGLDRLEVQEAKAGDIIALAGVSGVSIGDTIASVEHPEALPPIEIEEPTVKMTFGINTSPFVGREGSFYTSRMILDRLNRELLTNVSLRVERTDSADVFLVSGRGELHLAILVETMRREGFEFQISRPEPVTKMVDGRRHEPFEMLTIDTRTEYIGSLSEELSGRLAQMTDMKNDGEGNVRMEYRIPTRGLIGFRSHFLRATRGNGVMSSIFTGYEPMVGEVKSAETGVMIASETGVSVTFGLANAQVRGGTFIEAGVPVYEGMIIGVHPRNDAIVINVCKEKKLTNMRASTSEISKRLTPPIKMSLEEAMDFISPDELVEITPKSYRLRKRELSTAARHRQRRTGSRVKVKAT
ncbi:MAG: translational GTPase TypA [Chloroflexi bacterium]|nr:translational GTPase TypA [Chloroflexota bacterium]MCI0813410.1 translational GTPase TypA [Chloroflexota bacterium]